MSSSRETYQPSGRINWGRLVPWLVLSSLPALLLGYLVGAASRAGFRGLILIPLLGALLVGGTAWLAVAGARCRNRWVGAGLGLLLGLVAVIGYCDFDLDYEAVVQRVHAREVAEALCLGLLPALAGWSRASRPFSEQAGRWLHEHIFSVQVEDARDMAEALDEGDAEVMADCARPIPLSLMSKRGEVRLYYVADDLTSPVYLTLRIVDGRPWTLGWTRRLATRVRLTTDEAAALAERLRLPRARFGVLDVQPVVEAPLRAAPAAAIEDLPADEAGNVFNRRVFAVLTVVALAPLALALVLAIGLAVYVGLRWSDLGGGAKAGTAAIALAGLVVALVYTVRYGEYLPTRIQQRLIAAAIRKRSDALVQPGDPDAIYVGVVPRKNWGRMMLETSTDIGLLKIDAQRRELLFEGDRQRWRIPADSIASCEVEEYAIGPPDPKENNVFPLAVLRVNRDGGLWEAPLSPMRITRRRPTAEMKRQRCRQLRQRVRELLPPNPA
jgi:hypothetical protein